MKNLITLFGLLTSLFIHAQPLTGTWLSYYYRDKPGDKRMFFYRLYLKQSNDSLYGVFESLNIQADIQGLHPEDAAITARQVVYNHSFSSTDSTNFQLFAGIFQTATGGLFGKKSPIFQTLNCKAVPKEMPFHASLPIVYSTIPVNDGRVGELYMQKVSDSVPDFPTYLNSSSKPPKQAGAKAGIPKIFKQETKKELETEAPRSTVALPKEERTNEVQASFKVTSEIARIELYDNGEIDNDTVSLYLNGNLIADRERLSSFPLRLNVKLERGKENKLLLFAHNLGSIPPNTAFMLVTVGAKEYRVNLSSSLEKNAVIVFKRE